MKTSHVFWGTLFIGLGLLVLINNFTAIFMDWDTIWKLWPIVIILLGLSLLIKDKFGKSIIAGLAAIILALAIFATFKTAAHFVHDDFEIVFDDEGNHKFEITEYAEAFDSSITTAELNFNAGAGSFNLQETSEELIFVRTEGLKDNFRLKRYDSDNSSKLKLSMKKTRFRIGSNKYKNNVDITLNTNPTWDLNFDAGAAAMNLDLTPYKINNVSIEMGAASLELRIGDLNEETKIDIEAGASDIDIFIPEGSGCQIKTDDALSSKNFHNFTKIKSGFYKTDNFDEAEKKVYIEIDSGVSSLSVRRY